ncbi:MAG: hypothetical protein QXL67_00555 [Candidatus Bathyarchaeia archaeon]
MSHSILYRRRWKSDGVLQWLIEEFKTSIPNFDPFGEDGYLLDFAYKDLKVTLATSEEVKRILGVRKRLERLMESNPDELRSFLKVWVSRWLEKWRERVTLFDERDEEHKENEENFRDARKLYRNMKGRNELVRLVQKALVEQGEVCMVKLIAKNLILSEISRYSSERKRKGLLVLEPNPVKLYQRVTSQIRRLTKRKEPLVYLRLRPFSSYSI